MFRRNRVKIIKCNDHDYYANLIGKWVDVKEYKNEKIPYYDMIDTKYRYRYRLIKKDCVTKQELRIKKLERIIKKTTL